MALSAQVRGPVILNAQAGGAYSACGLDSIDDALSGQLGPLAGIHAAMRWAERLGCPTVVTAPVDTPFLPRDLVVRLTEAAPERRDPFFNINTPRDAERAQESIG